MTQQIQEEKTQSASRKIKTEFDTIVCPAKDWGMDDVFFKENRWYAVRINAKNLSKLKYFAPYETRMKAIRFVAKIKEIRPFRNSGKFEIVFDGEPVKITPIRRSKINPHLAPQNKMYTKFELFENARNLEDLTY